MTAATGAAAPATWDQILFGCNWPEHTGAPSVPQAHSAVIQVPTLSFPQHRVEFPPPFILMTVLLSSSQQVTAGDLLSKQSYVSWLPRRCPSLPPSSRAFDSFDTKGCGVVWLFCRLRNAGTLGCRSCVWEALPCPSSILSECRRGLTYCCFQEWSGTGPWLRLHPACMGRIMGWISRWRATHAHEPPAGPRAVHRRLVQLVHRRLTRLRNRQRRSGLALSCSFLHTECGCSGSSAKFIFSVVAQGISQRLSQRFSCAMVNCICQFGSW